MRQVEISSRARTLLRVMSYHRLEITQVFNNKTQNASTATWRIFQRSIQKQYCTTSKVHRLHRYTWKWWVPKQILGCSLYFSWLPLFRKPILEQFHPGPATPESNHCQSASLWPCRQPWRQWMKPGDIMLHENILRNPHTADGSEILLTNWGW